MPTSRSPDPDRSNHHPDYRPGPNHPVDGINHDMRAPSGKVPAEDLCAGTAPGTSTGRCTCWGGEGGREHGGERRIEARAPVDLYANRFQQGYPYLCRVTDISRKGMRLYTFHEPQLAPTLLSGLQFQLPGSPAVLTASAEVVFEDEASGCVGVRFLHLSKSTDAAIASYLAGVPG